MLMLLEQVKYIDIACGFEYMKVLGTEKELRTFEITKVNFSCGDGAQFPVRCGAGQQQHNSLSTGKNTSLPVVGSSFIHLFAVVDL